MKHSWKELADRVKRVIDEDQRTQERLQAEAQARLAAAHAARADLFNELASFAYEVGHFDVEQSDEGVTISFDEHRLDVRAVGQGDACRVSWPHSGSLQPELVRETFGGSWLFGMRSGEEMRWMPLFNRGLQALCHHALGLPIPADQSAHKAVLFTRDTQENEKIVFLDDPKNH